MNANNKFNLVSLSRTTVVTSVAGCQRMILLGNINGKFVYVPKQSCRSGPSSFAVRKTVLLVVIVNVLFILGINTLFYTLINCLYHKEGNTMKRRFLLLTYLLMSITILNADVKVKDVVVKPRWPWNGLVDITYSIECDEKDTENAEQIRYISQKFEKVFAIGFLRLLFEKFV